MNALEKALVKALRDMSDAELLPIAKQLLADSQAAKAPASRPKPAKPRDRAADLDALEKAVRAGKGTTLGELAQATGMAKARASALLAELRAEKRVYMAGQRAKARYGATPAQARKAARQA